MSSSLNDRSKGEVVMFTLNATFADIDLWLVIGTQTRSLKHASLEKLFRGTLAPEQYEALDLTSADKDLSYDQSAVSAKARDAVAELSNQWPRARLCVVVYNALIHYPKSNLFFPLNMVIGMRHDGWDQKTLNPKALTKMGNGKQVPAVVSNGETRASLLTYVSERLKRGSHMQTCFALPSPSKPGINKP